MASAPQHGPTGTQELARWAQTFFERTPSPDAVARVKSVVLDTLGCAIAGRNDPTALKAIEVARAQGGNPDCTVIATGLRTSAPLATFANGVLVRAIEFNDCYAGPGQIGHPSDNIPAALAIAELLDRSGRDLMHAVMLGYEVYGRMLDISDSGGPWDHVSVSAIACAIEAAVLMQLPPDRLAETIALAATQGATSREVRNGHISAAKSTAGAVNAQTAILTASLAAAGLGGPPHALDGPTGFVKQVLRADDCKALWTQESPERMLSVSLKAYPCFALAQGPVGAAIARREGFPADAIERMSLSFANCRPVSLRIPEKSNWSPQSREAADHSLPYLTAVAWIDGRVDFAQFGDARWLDPCVQALMQRIELHIDPTLKMAAPGAYTFRLDLIAKDGRRHVEEFSICPGHADNPLTWDEVKAKFAVCADGALSPTSQADIIGMIERLDSLPSIRPLMALLA